MQIQLMRLASHYTAVASFSFVLCLRKKGCLSLIKLITLLQEKVYEHILHTLGTRMCYVICIPIFFPMFVYFRQILPLNGYDHVVSRFQNPLRAQYPDYGNWTFVKDKNRSFQYFRRFG